MTSKSRRPSNFSLAETLTRFYPLAGRPNYNEQTIDCNDKGVLFLTARVKCHLADVLKEPIIDELYKLLPPWPPICVEDSSKDGPAQVGIQLNVFECGGVALSIFISHLICDAVTLAAFLKCWSEISRGSRDDQVINLYPCLPTSELFPQGADPIPTESPDDILDNVFTRKGKDVTRRFVFEEHAIAAIRDKAKSERVPNPTRVEAVSMFVWKRILVASTEVSGTDQTSVLNVIVDLRRRMELPQSKYPVGNIIWMTMVTCNGTKDDEKDINGLVSSFRTMLEEDVEKIVPTLKSNEGRDALLKYSDQLVELCRGIDLNHYIMTSWCRMGFTDMDFGWGKPVWVSALMPLKNTMTLVDGDCGKKIELWLTLNHRDMIVLENDREFLAFASSNPSVLI